MTTDPERRRFIENSLETFTSTLDELELTPDLLPSYTSDTRAILDRLYIPNMAKGIGDTKRLETPKEYQTDRHLGIIALHANESIFVDEHLARPTPGQFEHMVREFPKIGSSFSLLDMITNRHMVHKEYGPYLATTVAPHQFAMVTPGGMRALPRELGNYTTLQKPLMILNMDLCDSVAPPSNVGHEMMHMHDWDRIGFILNDDRSQKLDQRAWLENRGYYIGQQLNEALANARPELLDPYEEARNYTKAIDDVRAAFSHQDGFMPTRQYYEAMQERNLQDAIDIDYDIRKPSTVSQLEISTPQPTHPTADKHSLFRRLFRKR